VDQVVYRGYLIHLIAEADLWNTPGAEAGWSFHATPRTPNLPILPQAIFRKFKVQRRGFGTRKGGLTTVLRAGMPCKHEKDGSKQAGRFFFRVSALGPLSGRL
jgi:hypothetical protein